MDGAGCLKERVLGDIGKRGEVMRAPVSDGEVSAMGGWARGPLFFHLSCQFGPNET